MEEDIFGYDDLKLVIRFSRYNKEKFNSKKYAYSFEGLKEVLENKPYSCHFQKITDELQKITLLMDEQQVECYVTWQAKTFSYILSRKEKFQPKLLAKNIPTNNVIKEKCTIKLIDKEESYRTDRELEEWYKQVCLLKPISIIDTQQETEIWYQYIKAYQQIIKKRKQPFAISQYHPLQDIAPNKFSFKVDLQREFSEEYGAIERELKKLKVAQPEFQQDGSIFLKLKDIFSALDPILRRTFEGKAVREAAIGCILKVSHSSIPQQIRHELKQLGWKLNTNYNEEEQQVYFSNTSNNKKTVVLPKEIIHKYQLKRLGFHAKFRLTKTDDSSSYEAFFKAIDPNLYGSWYEQAKQRFLNEVIQRRKEYYNQGYLGVSKPNICEAYSYRDSSPSTREFWIEVERELYQCPFPITLNSSSQTLYFEFETPEELQERIEFLQAIELLNIHYNPTNFKYKVKTISVDQEQKEEQLKERIEKLRGTTFEITLPKQEKDGEWVIPKDRFPEKLTIGTLNTKASSSQQLTFQLTTYSKQEEAAVAQLKKILNHQAPIKEVVPNLSGDAAKIKWLKQAIAKLAQPKDSVNEKPINQRLSQFIFDSSRATPIYDNNKLRPHSEYWRAVVNNQLSSTLNDSQIRAILSALYSPDLCLLQGPPGTGKTTVIAEIIWQQIRQQAEQGTDYKILLTSETNLAVDNALEKLVGTHTTIVKPLRFGKSERFEEEGKKYSLSRIKQWVNDKHTKSSPLLALEEEEEELLPENINNNAVQHWMLSIGNRAQERALPQHKAILKEWHQDLALPSPEIKELFQKKYLQYANVIGSTCSSCGSPKFATDYYTIFDVIDQQATSSPSISISFDAVIMDEASKATPPEMAIPLCFAQKSIIIGDHKQLPPMINEKEFREILLEEGDNEELAQEIESSYLKESQFKRLITNPKLPNSIQATFDTQYRMHSQIGALIQQFYPELEQGLVCGIQTQEDLADLNNKASRYHGLYHKGFITPNTHVLWIDVNAPEAKEGTSRVNETEVTTIQQVLTYLKHSKGFEEFQQHWNKEKAEDKRLQEQEIGIISFYGKQVKKLMKVKKYAQKELGIPIRLKTVDKFQGMERNIIIVSTVRSDQIIEEETGKIVSNKKTKHYSPWGFADSPERLNVALSRAKRLLIVVGNKEHFCKFKNKEGKAIYKQVIQQIPSHHIIPYQQLDQYL